jgi:hypothetical protein
LRRSFSSCSTCSSLVFRQVERVWDRQCNDGWQAGRQAGASSQHSTVAGTQRASWPASVSTLLVRAVLLGR